MAKLNFDYDARRNKSIAHYRGLEIIAVQDSDAQNPWDEWDGNIPLIAYHNRDLTVYESEAGFPLLSPFSSAGLSDAILRRHMKAICAAFDGFDVYDCFNFKISAPGESGGFSHWLLKESKERARDYGGSLTDHKRELLSDALEGLSKSDKLETLSAIYAAIGWPALCTTSRGYSQGDYSELLFVVTPAFIKKTGAPSIKDSAYWRRGMESAGELYGAWAWGDIYGYSIEFDGDSLSSCFGYYGSDFEESGLASAALDAANWILDTAQKRRRDKLRELISNRVPLALRAPLLAQAAQPESMS